MILLSVHSVLLMTSSQSSSIYIYFHSGRIFTPHWSSVQFNSLRLLLLEGKSGSFHCWSSTLCRIDWWIQFDAEGCSTSHSFRIHLGLSDSTWAKWKEIFPISNASIKGWAFPPITQTVHLPGCLCPFDQYNMSNGGAINNVAGLQDKPIIITGKLWHNEVKSRLQKVTHCMYLFWRISAPFQSLTLLIKVSGVIIGTSVRVQNFN